MYVGGGTRPVSKNILYCTYVRTSTILPAPIYIMVRMYYCSTVLYVHSEEEQEVHQTIRLVQAVSKLA